MDQFQRYTLWLTEISKLMACLCLYAYTHCRLVMYMHKCMNTYVLRTRICALCLQPSTHGTRLYLPFNLSRVAPSTSSSSRPPAPPRHLSGSSSLAGAMDRSKGPSTSAAAPMAMAALAAAAAAGQSSSAVQADGALPPNGHGEVESMTSTLSAVGRGGASSTSSSPATARRGAAAGGGPSCQVERCAADLQEAKRYHRRHKVCEPHSKALVVLVAGLRQRFCQQCSR